MTSNELAEDVVVETSRTEEVQDLSVYVAPKTRKAGELGFGALATLFGALGFYFALEMTSETYSSPSVFPKMASVVIILCGLFVLYQAMKRQRPPKGESVIKYTLPRDVTVMILMIIAYSIALPRLHFIPSSYIFMVAGMFYLHRGKKIIHCCIYSAVAMALLVAIFRYLFLVILP